MSTAATTPDFDLIARPYRWLEYLILGSALERCRTHFLPALLDRRRALVLGDGDGRFLARLLSANSTLHADAVDISAAMLALLRHRCEAAPSNAAGRLETHNTSALEFEPTRCYDLVVAHFFLDCFTQAELEALITRLTPHLEPGALWLVSDFRIPAGPLSPFAHLLVRGLYLAFRILTGLRTTRLPDHVAVLNTGFTCIAQYRSLGGLLTTELWQRTSAHASNSSSTTSTAAVKSKEFL
jgi:SAM-dependent methyltransferase